MGQFSQLVLDAVYLIMFENHKKVSFHVKNVKIMLMIFGAKIHISLLFQKFEFSRKNSAELYFYIF